MELTRRAFMKWLAAAVLLVTGGGLMRFSSGPSVRRADAGATYRGPIHPLDETSIRRMGKWLG